MKKLFSLGLILLAAVVFPSSAVSQTNDSGLGVAKPASVQILSKAPGAASSADLQRSLIPPSRQEKAVRLNEQGVGLVFQGNKKEGIAKVKQALAHDPTNTTILYNLAGLYLSDAEPEKARLIMEQALEIEPRDLSFLNRSAEASLAQKDFAKAAIGYEKLAEIDPSYGEALIKLGTIYGMLQQWDRAEDNLRRARVAYGDDARVLSNLGNILVAQEKYTEAVKLLEQAQALTPAAENAVSLGIAYESLAKIDKSLANYKAALDLGMAGDKALEEHIRELETGN